MSKGNPRRMTLEDLERVVQEREKSRPKDSYTVKLLEEGRNKVAKKVIEEAAELGIEVISGPRERIVAEAADTLFHIVIALRSRGINLSAVYVELMERHLQQAGNPKEDRRGT